jgi:hypothetical protein
MIGKLSSPLAPTPLTTNAPNTEVKAPEAQLPQEAYVPSDKSGPSLSQLALAGVGAISVFSPMAKAAPQAQVQVQKQPSFKSMQKAYFEVEAEISAEKLKDLEIPRIAPEPTASFVLPGSARVELYSPSDAKAPSTDLVINLGHGLVLDSAGHLSLLTQSGSELKDFNSLEKSDGGYLTTHVTREGNLFRSVDPDGGRVNIDDKDNGAILRSKDAFYAVSGGTGGPSTIIIGHQDHKEQNYQIDWKGTEATIKLPNHKEIKVLVGLDKAIVQTAEGQKEYPITARHVIRQDADITVDQKFKVKDANQELEAFKAKLDEVEPGFTKSHPVTMALVEHTMKNADFADLLKTQKDITPLEVGVNAASVGTTLAVGSALLGQSQALGLGAQAMSFKGAAIGLAQQAMAAKTGAQAAAAAGNLSEAARLGQQAQSLASQAQAVGGQAKTIGGQAMEIGHHAKEAAHLAKTLTIVGGSMAIVDGLITSYNGFKEIDAVDAARQVVSAKLQDIAAEEDAKTFELAKQDFEELTPTLNKLARHADVTLNIGGVKVGCGALTLASAFMSGPVAPIVAGAVGSVCYAGTAIYDHYRD